jgi:non-specific serine/threonine protein kinase
MLEFREGDAQAARDILQGCLAVFRASDDKWNATQALGSLAGIALWQGDRLAAARHLADGLVLVDELAYAFGAVYGVALAAELAQLGGEAVRAARLRAAAHSLRERYGFPAIRFWRGERASPEALRAALGDERFERASSEGRSLSQGAAVTEALAFAQAVAQSADATPTTPPIAAWPAGLSEREVEVLRLLAAGRSNREIADALVISLNTVARHVSNIFDKVGAQNRTEAAAFAHRHGLAP